MLDISFLSQLLYLCMFPCCFLSRVRWTLRITQLKMFAILNMMLTIILEGTHLERYWQYFFSQLFAWPFWLLWRDGEEMGGSFVISVIMLQLSVCRSTYCCGTENFTIIG